MKIKKTLTTLALTGLLTAVLAAPALAKEIVQPTPPTTVATGDASVTAEVADAYTVTIPEKIELPNLSVDGANYATESSSITGKNIVIPEGQQLKVTVDPSKFQLKVNNVANTAVPFKLTVGSVDISYNTTSSETMFTTFEGGKPETEQTQNFSVTQTNKASYASTAANKYTGTITFTCTVADKTT